MDTVVFSVVYPGIESYFSEFLNSLEKQSSNKFSLFLLNDGLPNVREFLKRVNFDIRVMDVGAGKPAKLRKEGIDWIIKSGAESIIFADADDYFAENRIEVSKNILDVKEIVFNEVMLTGQRFAEPSRMIGTRIAEGATVDYDHLRTSNCMGLTNTAIRVKCIPLNFYRIPDHIIAFDWAFFALCLHAGIKGVFTKKTVTYYRQHENNLAGVDDLTEKNILRGVKVKSEHYGMLCGFYKEYCQLSDAFSNLCVKLQSDKALRKKYCQAVRKMAPVRPLWWESIKTLEDLGL